MKKIFTTYLLFLFVIVQFDEYAKAPMLIGSGEDIFYFANGNKFAGKIAKVTDDRVTFNVTIGERVIIKTFNKENILVAFNANGHYLVISSLSTDAVVAQKQIDDFNQAPIRESGLDLLIKATPMKVIPCSISYESDALINYQIPSGGAGSINKAELVVVLYKDGRHQFVMNPTEAGDLLKNASPDVANYTKKSNSSIINSSPVSVPVSEPAPTPALQQSIPTPSFQSTQSQPTSSISKLQITEDERQEYKAKAVNKVEEFGNYLSIITDKSLGSNDRDKAIDEATKLFLPEAMIEVSSANRGGTRKYKVREYLTRVKLLPYSSAKVEWSEIQYVKDLRQEADGNYYGTITGQQTFTGFSGKNGDDVMYSDKTNKNVKVKLQAYQKTIDGQNAVNWQLYLGNIGVANK